MPFRVYHYPNCSTCRKALKFLADNKVAHTPVLIIDTPPTKVELRRGLEEVKRAGGTVKKLFNTSGLVYKEMKLAERLPSLSEAEAIDLLAKNGKLIKRPFVVGKNLVLLGFNLPEWQKNLL